MFPVVDLALKVHVLSFAKVAGHCGSNQTAKAFRYNLKRSLPAFKKKKKIPNVFSTPVTCTVNLDLDFFLGDVSLCLCVHTGIK